MERIKKALERARGQRNDDTAPASDHREQSMEAALEGEVLPIDYTETRVVPYSPEVLLERRIVAIEPRRSDATPINILRTKVLQTMGAQGWNTIAVTSAAPGAGKSFLAANLAISIAMQVDYTALLVDADLPRPSIHTYFGLEPDAGLADYLVGEASLSSLMINPGIERLVLLPGNPERGGETGGMLARPRMARLVDELKSRYPSRIIIFDLPPLMATDDALAFLPLVDCALLVVESNVTTEKDLREALDLLKGTRVLGTVFNKAAQGPGDAYYGKGYY